MRYWLTTISALIGALLVVFPILGGFFGDEEADSDYLVVLIPLLVVIGGLTLAGLWWLRTGRFSETICMNLVGVGSVTFGFFFFWLLFIPPVLALVVLWFGIVKRGLVTELRPAPGS